MARKLLEVILLNLIYNVYPIGVDLIMFNQVSFCLNLDEKLVLLYF